MKLKKKQRLETKVYRQSITNVGITSMASAEVSMSVFTSIVTRLHQEANVYNLKHVFKEVQKIVNIGWEILRDV